MRAIDKKNRAGQSIVEAMMAIGILTTGLLGILALLSKSLFLNRVAADQARATYLAAEGIEITKSLMDHDVYAGLAGLPFTWGTCFVGRPFVTSGFEADYATTNCANLTAFGSSGRPLIFHPSSNLYDYNPANGVATNFTRRIRITSIGSGDEIAVNSIVTWSTGPVTSQSINMEDHFYNWHP